MTPWEVTTPFAVVAMNELSIVVPSATTTTPMEATTPKDEKEGSLVYMEELT